MKSALEVQEGGSHYKDKKIQPIQYIHANKLGFSEGSIVKYITRYKQKNGVEDLKKIKHYVDLIIELEYPDSPDKFIAQDWKTTRISKAINYVKGFIDSIHRDDVIFVGLFNPNDRADILRLLREGIYHESKNNSSYETPSTVSKLIQILETNPQKDSV